MEIPIGLVTENFHQNSDPDFVQVLIVLFQYFTIYNDNLTESEDFDEEQDFIQYNFDLIQKVTMIMASTLNAELLAKAARYLFSILELASETSDPITKACDIYVSVIG